MKKLFHAKTGFFIKKVYQNLIWDFYNKTNSVFLTFDDGPNPDVTDKILDILKKYNAKATFFCKGMNVERYPQLYNRIIQEGHGVGNHSYSHLKGWFTKNQIYYNDIDLARKYIDSNLFRPPHGKIGFSQISHLKKSYKIIMWDVLSFDFDPDTTTTVCINNVLNNIRSGSIVTFHDTPRASQNVLSALPKIIQGLMKRKYNLTQNIHDQLNKKEINLS